MHLQWMKRHWQAVQDNKHLAGAFSSAVVSAVTSAPVFLVVGIANRTAGSLAGKALLRRLAACVYNVVYALAETNKLGRLYSS
jgi:hypothetical protein